MVLVIVAAYLSILPNVDLFPDLEWHDSQRLGQLALFLVVVASAIIGSVRGRNTGVFALCSFVPARARVALVVAFLLGMVSAAVAPSPRWAFLEWAVMVLLVLLALSVARVRVDSPVQGDRVLVGILIFAVTAYILKVCAAYTAAMVERLPLNIWWLLDGFSNPRFFGHFQAMTLPLLVLPAMIWAKTLWSRAGWALLPIFWWMLAIASGTRGTWLAMIIACAVVFACMRHSSCRWLKWQWGTFLAGLAAYGLFFFLVPALLSVEADTVNRLPDIASLSFRDVIWAIAVEQIATHPVLGIGPMHFAYYPNPVAAHPHMSLLQWAAEWGLPSAMLVLGVVFYAGLSYVNQLRATVGSDVAAYTLRLALFASMTAAAVQSLVDGVIVMPYSQTLLAVICGWSLGSYISYQPVAKSIGRTAQGIGMIAVVLSTGFMLRGVLPEISGIAGSKTFFGAPHQQQKSLPRFWARGWIYE